MDVPERESEFERYRREMDLVDQIIGLRASLAQEAVRNSPSRQRVEQLEAEILMLRRSTTWRVGRLMMLPARIARRLLGRIGAS